MDAQLETKRQEIATTRVEALAAARTFGLHLPLTASSCDPSLVIEALHTTNQFRHVAIALAKEMQSPLDGEFEFEFELTDDHRVFLREVVKVLQHPQAQQRFDLLVLHWGALLIEASTIVQAAKHKIGTDSVQLPPLLVVDQTTSKAPLSEGDKVRRGYAALFQLDKTAVKKGDVRTIEAIAAPLATATEAWMRAVIPIASEMCTFFESSTRNKNGSKTSLPTSTRSPSSVAAKPENPSTPSRKRANRNVAEDGPVETTGKMEVDEATGPRSAKAPKKDTVDRPAQPRSPSVADRPLRQEPSNESRVEQANPNAEVDDEDEDMMPSTQPPLPPARSRILSRLQAAAQQQAAKFEAPASTSSNSNKAAPSSAGPVLTDQPLAHQSSHLPTTSVPRNAATNGLKRDASPASPKALKRIVVSPPKRPGTATPRVFEENESSLEQHNSGSNGSGSSYTSQPPPPAQTLHTPPVSTASSNGAYVSVTDDPNSSFDSAPLVLNTQSTTSSSASEKRKNTQSQPTASGSKDDRSQTSTQNTDSLEYVDDVVVHKRRFEEQHRLKAAAQAKKVAPPIQNDVGAVSESSTGEKGKASVRAEGNDNMDHDAVEGLGIGDMMSDDDESVSSHLVPHRRFEELEEEATHGPEDDEAMGEILSTRVSPFF